jgi:hypothetical protein
VSETILLCTGVLEVGLAAGYALHAAEQLSVRGARMVLSMLDAMGVR